MNVDVKMTAKFTREDIITLIQQQLKEQGYSMIDEPSFNLELDTSKNNYFIYKDRVFKDVEVRVRPID